jgi:hypothetical protein
LNSSPRQAGYEAPFVGALYPMRLEQPGTARISPEETSATSEPNTRTSDDLERVIESLAELLSSGRPLSEVLAEAKQLTETLSTPTDASRDHPADASAIASADTATDDHHSPLATDSATAESIRRCAREEQKSLRFAWRPSDVALWLLPAGIIAMLAMAAGAVLAHLPRQTQSSFLALTLTPEPEIAPIPKTDAVLETHPEPSVSTAKQGTREPFKAGQQLSPEQVSLLLARGDELVKRADVVPGRLFYERAADAGNAQAALRLGASYDPSFLVQAGIRGVRGDPALATHWYKRARDLGAVVEAEALLKGLGIH